jgi:hypothetical protein
MAEASFDMPAGPLPSYTHAVVPDMPLKDQEMPPEYDLEANKQAQVRPKPSRSGGFWRSGFCIMIAVTLIIILAAVVTGVLGTVLHH